MNATDVLKYGHGTVQRTLEAVPPSEWDTPGVCGVWSTREIIAHLASYEKLLVDVLSGFLGGGPTPTLDEYEARGMEFNDTQVALRQDLTPQEVLAEYQDTQARTMSLVAQLPAETLRQPGSLPWYGMEYSLDDYIVYQFYGHKREHTAQIDVLVDRLKRQGAIPSRMAASS